MRPIRAIAPGLQALWRTWTGGISRDTIGLCDQEHDAIVGARRDLDAVAGFLDQVRNIDHRQWIGAMDFQPVARFQRLERLSRFQRGQWTFQSGEIEPGGGHACKMAKHEDGVNAPRATAGHHSRQTRCSGRARPWLWSRRVRQGHPYRPMTTKVPRPRAET